MQGSIVTLKVARHLSNQKTMAVCFVYGIILFCFSLVTFYAGAPLARFSTPTLILIVVNLGLYCVAGWVYWILCQTPPGFVDPSYTPEVQNKEDFCEECNQAKPPRSRHCHVCNKCILGMDHHCPWVPQCIGKNNRKLFILFVMYSAMAGVISCLSLITRLILHFTGFATLTNLWLILLYLAIVSGASQSLTLFCLFLHHFFMILFNLTSKELMALTNRSFRTPYGQKSDRPYDKGVRSNICEHFGDSRWQWFLPIPIIPQTPEAPASLV
ncbi:S-acyltransferase 15 [Pelomyxa schiedti]|nr:S-acyltransferase 15 [Pelomyxa schiedti]